MHQIGVSFYKNPVESSCSARLQDGAPPVCLWLRLVGAELDKWFTGRCERRGG